MADIVSTIEKVLDQSSNMESWQKIMYYISSKVEIWVAILMVFFGILFIIWFIRGIKE